jgi:tetratricopeptide (TPR) repeat protein
MLGLALFGLAPAMAQIPNEFKNLELLPKDVTKRELVAVMRSFSDALGVRCTHCHVGPVPGELEGVDFASDELEPKRVARQMMKLVDEINGKLLPATGRRTLTRVRCVTCHRGVTDPEPLDAMLLALAEKEGAAAALTRYDELRKEHYGSDAYDFGTETLNQVAESLVEKKQDVDGAIALVRRNLEHDPDAPYSHLMLGQLLAQKGDKAGAIASVERALALDPDNRWAKQQLERLKAGS